ncbi:MAG: glycosyltransferase family A protein [Candidatus Hydrothermarchaeota archaeon]
MESASIVTMTHNRAYVLGDTLEAMLSLDYPPGYEVIVVNDGSTDNTREVLARFKGRIRVIDQERRGPCAARNTGIRAARHPFVIVMDDDCIPAREWLRDLMAGFDAPDVGVVSAFDVYGGTSTAFRREALEKTGLYDEEYFYYREDTDLVFRIMDAGYRAKKVRAVFEHRHEYPQGFLNGLRHAWERLFYHVNDVLLYKKNPERAREFLDVRLGFIRNPMKDFQTVTYTWSEDIPTDLKPGERLRLSSPRGIVYLEAKTPLHTLAIIASGIAYALALKLVRLWGSIKYRKLLL